MRNLFLLSSLAAFTAVGCFAQLPIPLNTIPSRIVGHPQPESTTIVSAAPNLVEGRELFSPEGIALDTSVSPPIVYVADTGNNRVLAWQNAAGFKNGQKADFVIGQQDMYHTTPQGPAGTFQTGLAAPTGLMVDSNGNLFVADTNNNRILRYPRPLSQFQQGGSITPDLWVGQPSIRSNAPNVNGSVDNQGLNLSGAPFPVNMALDNATPPNLWVVDGGNRRVLRFPAAQISAGGGSLTADLVIGQVDFKSTNQPGPSSSNRTVANGFAYPIGIAFDSKGNLYVTDSSTDLTVGRVLVFAPPFTIGQSASRFMGVPQSSPSQDAVDRTFMEGATSIFFIASAGKMGIVDSYSSRILLFDTIDKWPDPSQSVSPMASFAFGQADCHNRGRNGGTATYVPAPSESTVFQPLAAAFFNNELYVADTGNSRMIVLPVANGTANCAQAQGTVLGSATRLLGQDTFKMIQPNLIEGREFYFLTSVSSGTVADAGVAVDNNSDIPHLYVADTYNNRVLGFKDFRSLAAGSKADLVLGQQDFNSGLCNVTNNPNAMTAATLCRPAGLVVDSNGDLYVADMGNNRVLRFPSPFAHQGTLQQADLVLGQHQFTFSITDPTSSTMSAPYGLAIGGSNGLLVSDIAHNRVLYFPFTANGTFVAGTDNGKAATKVFGQQDFSSTSAGSDVTQFNAPHGLSTDNEARLYVADSGNNRIMIFDHIFGTLSPNTGARADLPLGGFQQPRSVFVNQITSEIWVGDTSSTVRKFPSYATLILNPAATASVSSAGFRIRVA
jgi:sugar lactone lactonase YvrE